MPYADHATFVRSLIVENKIVARDTWQIRIQAPLIAQQMLPGQFVMIRIAGMNDPLIGRALAIFNRNSGSEGAGSEGAGCEGDGSEGDGTIELVYVVKAKFTQALATLQRGQMVEVWGPLGNAFSTKKVAHLILVAGGIGQTPMLVAAKEALGQAVFGSERLGGYAQKVTLCYGARSADLFANLAEFRETGMDVQLSTDDGSCGPPRLVTQGLSETIDRASQAGESMRIVCCGPEPMMQAVAEIARQRQVDCEVSLEAPMACGIGICFTCVARIAQGDGTWDYRRTCIDGPIFEASQIVW